MMCRAFLDEGVREPVQLGYNEWSPAPVPTPPRSEQQMSPLGGGSALAAASGEWPGSAAASTAQYGSTAEQQYSATNGNAGQYARAAAAPGTGRYQEVGGHGAQQLPPAAAMGQQVRAAAARVLDHQAWARGGGGQAVGVVRMLHSSARSPVQCVALLQPLQCQDCK
jgi:hypothetical protein